MTLRDLIIKYRTEHGMSQRQFAKKCGMTGSYISMIENNMNTHTGLPIVPTFPTLEKIAKGLDITVDYLFHNVDDMPVSLANTQEEADERQYRVAKLIRLASSLSDQKLEEAINYVQYLIGK